MSYQETPSGFSFVMIKTWQRILKTPDMIIGLVRLFLFFKHAAKDERESRHISSLGTVLICCQDSQTSLLLILGKEWMLRMRLSNNHCIL